MVCKIITNTEVRQLENPSKSLSLQKSSGYFQSLVNFLTIILSSEDAPQIIKAPQKQKGLPAQSPETPKLSNLDRTNFQL